MPMQLAVCSPYAAFHGYWDEKVAGRLSLELSRLARECAGVEIPNSRDNKRYFWEDIPSREYLYVWCVVWDHMGADARESIDSNGVFLYEYDAPPISTRMSDYWYDSDVVFRSTRRFLAALPTARAVCLQYLTLDGDHRQYSVALDGTPIDLDGYFAMLEEAAKTSERLRLPMFFIPD